jgi:transcriptional regulator with XRE-family HTH domain
MTLSEYVQQVMAAKGLNQADVARNSQGLISDSYLQDIISGKTKRPSLETLKGLAKGLGVSYYDEMLRVASGDPLEKGWTPESLVYALGKIVRSDALTDAVQQLVKMPEEEVQSVCRRLKRSKK